LIFLANISQLLPEKNAVFAKNNVANYFIQNDNSQIPGQIGAIL
jgi:hypothetical protein